MSSTSTTTSQPSSAAATNDVVRMKLADLVGYDRSKHPRALFLYDGGCGVCKFLVQFAAVRSDRESDAVRFAPLQCATAQDICHDLSIVVDMSTAVLIVDHGRIIYTHSASILRMAQYIGRPYAIIGLLLLYFFPKFVRDFGYGLFARNRGDIWKGIKRVTGLGDTLMTDDLYRSKIVGLDWEQVATFPASWGFGGSNSMDDENENNNESGGDSQNKKKKES
jgi:predicted DCC family thiol-disulfide oxidoreductase YuxK